MLRGVVCCVALVVLTFAIPFHGTAEGLNIYVGTVPPFTIVSDDGVVSGAAVDVVAEIMEAAGEPIDVSRIQAINWARSVEETENRPGSILFCTARTPERESRFKWVGPISELNLGLVARKQRRISIGSPEDLSLYRIGVIRNSAPMQILEKVYGIRQKDMTLLANDLLQFKMLQAGRVDLITQADTAAPSWIRQLGYPQDDFEMVYVLKHLPLYLAFNRATSDAFIERAQNALDSLKKSVAGKKSRYDRIMEKYLVDGPISMQAK